MNELNRPVCVRHKTDRFVHIRMFFDRNRASFGQPERLRKMQCVTQQVGKSVFLFRK